MVVLTIERQRQNLSNLYDMDQLRKNVNVRSLLVSNALYGSIIVSKEKGSPHHCPDVAKNKQQFSHFMNECG